MIEEGPNKAEKDKRQPLLAAWNQIFPLPEEEKAKDKWQSKEESKKGQGQRGKFSGGNLPGNKGAGPENGRQNH